MKILADNLSADTTEEDLRMLFECFGKVASVQMRRQGSAMVAMPSNTSAKEAIAGLHGQNLKGFDLSVTEMIERSRQKRGGRRRRR